VIAEKSIQTQDPNAFIEPVAESANDQELPVLEMLNELNAAAIRLRLSAGVKSQTGVELSGAEHAVLEIINRQGAATVPQIARERFTSRQNIQIIVDRLASEEHVEVVGNPAHKRSVLVRLTEAGRTWLQEDEKSRKQLHKEIGSLFSAEEIARLRSALRKLHGALGKGNGRNQNGHPPDGSSRPTQKPKPVSVSQTSPVETIDDPFPITLL
jgi:DNA-binding MarR family transcriptional regulator